MSDVKDDILDAIEESDRDLSIEEIAERTGRHRNTVSKWVTTLEAEGRIVTSRRVGTAVFFDVPRPA